jgi:protein-disulfide isomerase
VYLVAAAAAVVVAGALIGVSLSGGGGDDDATPTPAAPPPATGGGGGEETFLTGITQTGIELGDPDATVVVVEFADLQCPFCAQFANETFPDIVEQYVRPGDVKFEFNGVSFIGPDSEKALRAVYAAAQQNKLWDVAALLYVFQGEENSGWVTDDLLREVGARVPGLDVERMLDDMDSEAVDQLLAQSSQIAESAQIEGTPTFIYAKAGEAPTLLGAGAIDLASFQERIDPLLEQ